MRAAQPEPTNSSRSAGSQRWAASRPAAGLVAVSNWVIVVRILSNVTKPLPEADLKVRLYVGGPRAAAVYGLRLGPPETGDRAPETSAKTASMKPSGAP